MNARLVIIGDGIAARALAYEATQREIVTVILGKNLKGTTHSATGLIAPRPDYLISDHDLVRQTSFECLRWSEMFGPEVVRPKQFLIPLDSELPTSTANLDTLLYLYDELARSRSKNFNPHCFVSPAVLEKMEPNLRKGVLLGGAIAFTEWTVDPVVLLNQLEKEAFLSGVRRFDVQELKSIEVKGGLITEITALLGDGHCVKINNKQGSLVVVNTTGPWIKEMCAKVGIAIDYQLKSGLQIEFPGWYFQSGIITFDKQGEYIVCLQKNGALQVGPTNSNFSGHLSNYQPSIGEISSLVSPFLNLLEEGKIPKISSMKWGFRVKPGFIDTNRPVIWRHSVDGLYNFYSMHPGKMALALRAADEMLAILVSDGWVAQPKWISLVKPIHLDGHRKLKNELKLFWLKFGSLLKLVLFYAKFELNKTRT